MAKIYNSENHFTGQVEELKNLRNKHQTRGALLFFGGLPFHFIIPFIITFIFWYFAGKEIQKASGYESEYNKRTSGLEGEKATLDLLRKLPDSYTIISDLNIVVGNKSSQLDSVVVGPNGVFVVETKNVKGSVVGNSDEYELTINKIGRRGGEYSNTMYNPLKQVNTHVGRLAALLKQQNIRAWVQGSVYFSNPETQVSINNSSSIPVFKYNGIQLLSYIEQYNKCNISQQEQQRIISLLSNYIIK